MKEIFKNGLLFRKPGNIVDTCNPKTVDDVIKIVKMGKKLVAVGSLTAHSRINEPLQKSCAISSHRINHIYRISKTKLHSTKQLKKGLEYLIDPIVCPREQHPFKNYFINVGAGVTVEQLTNYLRPKGLMLSSTTNKKRTIGGISQTDCASSGWSLPSIASQIVSFRIILPDGSFATIGKNLQVMKDCDINNSNLFNTVLCSAGTLGFIYDMVIFTQDYIDIPCIKPITTKWNIIRNNLDFIKDWRNLYLYINPYSEKVEIRNHMITRINVISTECAIPVYKNTDIRTIINSVVHYITSTGKKPYPLQIAFGRPSKFYLSASYHKKTLGKSSSPLGIIFIEASYPIKRGIEKHIRDLINLETYMEGLSGTTFLHKLQGPVGSIKSKYWKQYFDQYPKNPFANSFAEEIEI